jgi:hypothetical protein
VFCRFLWLSSLGKQFFDAFENGWLRVPDQQMKTFTGVARPFGSWQVRAIDGI